MSDTEKGRSIDRIVPGYKDIPGNIELNNDEQEALRKRVLAEGRDPEQILKEIIRNGLGLTEEDV